MIIHSRVTFLILQVEKVKSTCMKMMNNTMYLASVGHQIYTMTLRKIVKETRLNGREQNTSYLQCSARN